MRVAVKLMIVVLAAACQSTAITAPSTRNDLSAELIRQEGTRPPDGPPGACWDRDILPTVIETVTDQILVTPEERGPDGAIIRPAVFRTESSQQIVQERGQVWFRAPCIAQQTVAFVATLQRALKARGLYLAPVNGAYDPATAEAVRRYQAMRGFDSPRLTLTAARELGLINADFGLSPAE
jgi:peptidoglycan hydrolase-like protein with peptidoglycan-binding domain